MNDSGLLKLIRAAIQPAKNVRVHLTREVFDHSLTSQMPSEVDEELLFPVFEYEFTLCDKWWMCLETMKGCGLKNQKEQRLIRKTLHRDGSLGFLLRKDLAGRDVRHEREMFLYPGVIGIRMTRLSELWAEFMGDGVGVRMLSFDKSVSNGFYSVERGNIRYLLDENKGHNVVRMQHLFDDGRIDYESIHDIKQFSNGVWFQMGYDMIRYADPQTRV